MIYSSINAQPMSNTVNSKYKTAGNILFYSYLLISLRKINLSLTKRQTV